MSTETRTQEVLRAAATVAAAEDLGDLSERTLHALSGLLRPQRYGLYVFDPVTMRPTHIAARGTSDFFLAAYEERGRDRDPVLEHVLTHRTPIDSESLMPRRDWLALPLYREVLRMHRVDVSAEAPVLHGDEVLGTLNIGDVRRFDAKTLALLGGLGELVGSMLHALRVRTTVTEERDRLRAALESSDQALVMSDLRKATRFVSAAGRALLESIVGAAEPSFLEDLLCSPMAAEGGIVRNEVLLTSGEKADLQLRSVLDEEHATMLTYMRLSASPELSLPGHLAQALSPRERDVADLAVRGQRDAEIAERLHLSKHTVKEYLRNAYRKLGVSSRLELVVLAANQRDERG